MLNRLTNPSHIYTQYGACLLPTNLAYRYHCMNKRDRFSKEPIKYLSITASHEGLVFYGLGARNNRKHARSAQRSEGLRPGRWPAPLRPCPKAGLAYTPTPPSPAYLECYVWTWSSLGVSRNIKSKNVNVQKYDKTVHFFYNSFPGVQ